MLKKQFYLGILIILSSVIFICPGFTLAYPNQTDNIRPFYPRIEDQIYEIMEQAYIPSVATAVVRNDSVIWAKGFGIQNDPHTIYMIGDVTKTFTATSIFQIYEQGLIQLDDDVNMYLPFSLRHPDYNNTPITIQMLLTHYSGLNNENDLYSFGMAADGISRLGMENPFPWLPYPFWIEQHLTPNGSLYIPQAWTSFEPGITRYYSDIGYDVLGYILELVTGKPVWEYIKENIFNPLEMQSTAYNFTIFDESQLAKPHIYMFELDPQSTGNKMYPNYNYLGYSSGAIRSNVYDLARFSLVHLHKGISKGVRILEEQTIEIMHQMQAGWMDGNASLADWGEWSGFEGDMYGFQAKTYGIHDGSTTVPYAVITLANQGVEEASEACFEISSKLQEYIHIYDAGYPNNSNEFIMLVLITSFPLLLGIVIILIFKLKKGRS